MIYTLKFTTSFGKHAAQNSKNGNPPTIYLKRPSKTTDYFPNFKPFAQLFLLLSVFCSLQLRSLVLLVLFH
ncbi:unnamed protein product [Rhizophagus irregularis]|nr:unnamed protein product [Rhizophagus irregularis]CAB5380307.1 unnamed protein product [Rhizophagus irregularis]